MLCVLCVRLTAGSWAHTIEQMTQDHKSAVLVKTLPRLTLSPLADRLHVICDLLKQCNK